MRFNSFCIALPTLSTFTSYENEWIEDLFSRQGFASRATLLVCKRNLVGSGAFEILTRSLQQVVERIKAKLKHQDEFGVINYNNSFLFLAAFALLYTLIALLAVPLLWFETTQGGDSANITTYADAFWTLQMSASTIGFGDFYPVTLGGRSLVALVFYLGVGLVGFIGAILASGFFGFAETSVKNRELRKQNQEILEHNQMLERKLDRLIERLESRAE